MYDADFIIIGSGHNGLTTALMLAREGYKVLVLERSKLPGGAAKTSEVTIKGFRHDLFATNIGLFLGSPIYKEMGKQLHEKGLEVVIADKPFASAFPDGDVVRVYMDKLKTLNEFARQSLKDAESWKQLLAYFEQVSPYLMSLSQKEMPSWPLVREVYKLYRNVGRDGVLDLVKMLLSTSRQFTESWFESEKIKSLFIPWGFHLDYAPDVAGGAMFPFLEVPLDYKNGMALAKGGISNMINAMVSLLESMGGKVELGRQVEQILLENGRAVGVILGDGQKVYAQHAVIANIHPSQLIEKLVPVEALPSIYVQKARKFQNGPGTMMIHMALDGPLKWNASEDLSQFCYVHICPYTSDVAQTYTDALNQRLPASPMLVIGQQSAVDSSRAPEGKHTLWVQVRALPYRPKSDALDLIHPDTWENIKEQYAERVIDKISHYAPDIKQKILSACTMSPADLVKENPNLVGGDSVGGSHQLQQNYLFRPIPGRSKYDTPIEGLYLVGASTWPGAGLNATSGYLLAKRLLRKNFKRKKQLESVH
ncbi:FAD dependent oxidoreductase [Neobacillus bataviensis LMG 21833]|uniref:Pyridine nucleotide-disulfide oxidoreductase domain-containing protein 2 n=1 Tax=Neobacillus bataviensis LMG 21833 TaxID=1117379 RepID=K6BUM9_9BACI|nr:NAD(P)/FAD-dependent oxidoreductase [Neobacillus bataviensis]EKN62620.1 FAD dependent oxidoreductase [Neobacillus bataviensis LMG 21833]